MKSSCLFMLLPGDKWSQFWGFEARKDVASCLCSKREKTFSVSKFQGGTLNVLVNSFFCLLQITSLFYIICCSVSHSLILIFSFMVLIWCLQLNSLRGLDLEVDHNEVRILMLDWQVNCKLYQLALFCYRKKFVRGSQPYYCHGKQIKVAYSSNNLSI